MTSRSLDILVVGATGSIGRPVVKQALEGGHRVRALVRRCAGHGLPSEVDIVPGDLTRPETLAPAVDGVDAIIFAHGTYAGISAAEAVDYGGVRNVLLALDGRNVRIALMTAIGVTDRKGAHDWKRRAERLVRASGCPATIVRPGWFDYNAADQLHLLLLQGDRWQSGTPRDGVVARRQIAQVLVSSLNSSFAAGKTFELVAELGPAQVELDCLFAELDTDISGDLDGVRDNYNMPLQSEPAVILNDLARVRAGLIESAI